MNCAHFSRSVCVEDGMGTGMYLQRLNKEIQEE